MVDRSGENTLRALLARYEATKDRCGESLAEALRSLGEREVAVRSAREGARLARERLESALRASRMEQGASRTALQLRWTHERIAHTRDEVERALARRDAAEQERTRAARTVEAARWALAEAEGRRDAIARRLDAVLRDARARAEAMVEDESADRRRTR